MLGEKRHRDIMKGRTGYSKDQWISRSMLGLVVVLRWLVEQEVGRQFLILVTGEIRLDGCVAVEAQPTEL